MATEMQQWRGLASEWASLNPILGDGELGFEEDTQIIRVGDGSTHWNDLGVPGYIPRSTLTGNGEMLVGSGPGAVTKIASPGASSAKILVVQADGSIAWVDDTLDVSTLESIGHAAGNYEQIAFETTIDGSMESSSHAAATYITIANATDQHSLYDTLDHMAATYVGKAYAAANYESKWTYKSKAANTTRSSTTTLTADPDLVFPVVAGGTYLFEMGLFMNDQSNAADFLLSMTSGLSSSWHAAVHGAPAGTSSTDATINHRTMGTGTNELASVAVHGATTFFYVSVKGIVAVTTAGNFGLTWAQAVSNATGTAIYRGSYLKANRLS